MEWAALEAAGSSTRGSGGAPSGPASPLGVPSYREPPGAPRGGVGAELGHCQGGYYSHHARPQRLLLARARQLIRLGLP